MTYHAHICASRDCGHGQLAHQYLLGTRTNVGECLAPNCVCFEYHEEED